MAKLTLNDVENLNNQSSAVATINANSALIEEALENTLSLDGTEPNEMNADLDMNSSRILNLPAPIDETEPVRLGDLESLSNGTFQVGDLLDVDLTEPLVDGDFLRYDADTEKWVNEQSAGTGAAPDSADYLVKTANGSLSAERVVTDNTSITWDWATAGQAKAQRAALTGDVTASANSNATTIASDAVTFAKMQNIATNSLIGRDTAGSGDPENILLDDTLSMDGSGNLQRAALTGDVTASAGSNATTIADNAVTLAKMNDIATSRVIGRVTSGTGDPEALTGAQVASLINFNDLADVSIDGVATGDIVQYSGTAWINQPVGSFGAPSSADYLVKTANAGLSGERVVTDGTSITADWTTPAQVTLKRAALTGDVTASADSNATTIANDAVTYAKMQNVSAADKLLGRGNGGGSGDVQEITLGTALSMSGTTLNASVGSGGGLLAANNLSDVASASTSRTNLGLGTGDSPEFTAINVGAASDTTITRSAAGVIAVEGIPLYPNIPQNSQSAAYTTVLADAGKHILHPTADNNARTFTIDSNANVAYPIGTAITFVNQINTVTIAITSDTLTLAGAGSTGSRTLAANGIATALKIASTSWIISGTGLT